MLHASARRAHPKAQNWPTTTSEATSTEPAIADLDAELRLRILDIAVPLHPGAVDAYRNLHGHALIGSQRHCRPEGLVR